MTRFLSQRTLAVIQQQGLHKVAAAMNDVEVFNIKEAARIVGTKAYIQRQETKKIAAGIEALAALHGEKTGGVLTELLSRQAVPGMIGAAGAVIPDLMSGQPVDQDAMMRHALMGGALGVGGGALAHGGRVLRQNPQLAQDFARAIPGTH